ncbi:MAG: hypothetical protein DLM52_12955 [Chthoniobacterales bacterium]|nr:MAG: hypothetical protein DLM52_12955 [Chthoniobacterales bacterium]
MKLACSWPRIVYLWLGLSSFSIACATSTYQYKEDEYVVITGGRSPDGQYSITAHGEGEYGDENFHLYLTDARTGKKLGQLDEVKDPLDTGADAFHANWSRDSREVSISYRVDRHEAVILRYRVESGHARYLSGPAKTDKLPDK